MHPLSFPILADENIHDEVVYFLRGKGIQIESIKERNLRGSTDSQIVALAQKEGKSFSRTMLILEESFIFQMK